MSTAKNIIMKKLFLFLVITAFLMVISQGIYGDEKPISKPEEKAVQLSILTPAEGSTVDAGQYVTVTVYAWGSVAGIQEISCQGEGDIRYYSNYPMYPPTTSITEYFIYQVPWSVTPGEELTINARLTDYVDGIFNQYRHVTVSSIVTPTVTPTPTPTPTPDGYVILQLESPNTMYFGLFGSSVSGVPDLNNDGYGDAAVGAIDETHNSTTDCGCVYIFEGDTGNLLRTILSPNIQEYGEFGSSVSGISDINSDGAGDIIVGAPYEQLSGSPVDAGVAYVFSGATGSLIHTLRSTHEIEDGNFGSAVSNVPDLSGDGVEDILVSTGVEDAGVYNEAGRAYVFNGATGALIIEHTSPNPVHLGNFGASVSGIPDLTGDNRGNIIAGAPEENIGIYSGAGRCYVFDASSTVPLRTIVSPNIETYGNFGGYVSGAPDLTGDGYGDYIIGASLENPECAYVYNGHTGSLVHTLIEPSGNDGFFASRVAGIPDVNGDSLGDLLVSSPTGDSVYLYDGSSGEMLEHLESPNISYFTQYFGGSISGMPDVNDFGDGDIVIGASQESPGGISFGGLAYIIKIEPPPSSVNKHLWNMYE